MRTIYMKTWPEYFKKILSGEKIADIRLADFDVEVGDKIILKEWDPITKEYTGRKIEKVVDQCFHMMLNNFWTMSSIKGLGVWLIQFDQGESQEGKE